ncbi:unnamed protein product [Caenorhabditis auriculariae]|uniref:Uncharacterized protein n=1 Tax=Caenorhabditis auriculariae TaxID=2777116 RepID=A0A8S1HTI5_9PELO|nr:unnamed protein product [Caenorhabditis auriculariae]
MARFYTLGLLFTFLFGASDLSDSYEYRDYEIYQSRKQLVLQLSSFPSHSFKKITNVEYGMHVYVSGNVDSEEVLTKIVLVSGGTSRTMKEEEQEMVKKAIDEALKYYDVKIRRSFSGLLLHLSISKATRSTGLSFVLNIRTFARIQIQMILSQIIILQLFHSFTSSF